MVKRTLVLINAAGKNRSKRGGWKIETKRDHELSLPLSSPSSSASSSSSAYSTSSSSSRS